MTSDPTPLVLLHGVTLSGDVWRDVEPTLSRYHRVFTPTAAGHRGGPPAQSRPATIADLVDATERYLDDHGLSRPHLAGNSMGGWIAIELARRGRAATVCALSPAGFWYAGRNSQTDSTRKIARLATLTRPTRSMAQPLVFVVGCTTPQWQEDPWRATAESRRTAAGRRLCSLSASPPVRPRSAARRSASAHAVSEGSRSRA
jgi:pimeloyl-ACP methyl ester carboxylesterase